MARFRLLEEDPGAGGGLRGLWPRPVTLDLPPLALGFPRCSVGGVRVGATPRALTCSGSSQRVRGGGGEGKQPLASFTWVSRQLLWKQPNWNSGKASSRTMWLISCSSLSSLTFVSYL